MPSSIFLQVHHCFQLNLALKEAVSDIKELTIFFAGLTGIHTFFNLSYGRRDLLNKCMTQTLGQEQATLDKFIASAPAEILVVGRSSGSDTTSNTADPSESAYTATISNSTATTALSSAAATVTTQSSSSVPISNAQSNKG